MISKKLNAVLSLIITFLLVDHTIACSIHMIQNDYSQSLPGPAWLLAVLVAVHALASLYFVFVRHDSKFIKYTAQNVRTILQRDSGFLMVIAGIIHAFSASTRENMILFCVSHLFVVLFSMLHTAVSVPNALVTLGIVTSERKHKIIFLLCAVVCALLFLLGAAGSVMGVN